MKRIFCLLAILYCTSMPASEINLNDVLQQAPPETEFLEVDDAFRVTADYLGDEILVRWEITPGYYLYRHQFEFEGQGVVINNPNIPDGLDKDDPYFGPVQVYYKHVEVSMGISDPASEFVLRFEYQGCAEAGLCYPPTERMLRFVKTDDGNFTAPAGVEEYEVPDTIEPSTTNEPEFIGEREMLSEILTGGNMWLVALAFFGAGILLTFTPCVLPMIPILSSIIAGQSGQLTAWKSFKLAFVYVQSMAVTYAIFGILVAQAGGALSGFLQSPPVLIGVAILFIILAMSMFGLYELQLPQKIQDKLQDVNQRQSGGQYFSVALMGVLATLVVSPCTSAPLTAALLVIAQNGDVVSGGFSLYMLGIGMGLPLLLLGAGGGKWLPKAGGWMDKVKAAFGYMMLGLALYITSHLLPGGFYLGLWAVLLIHASYYFGAFRKAKGALSGLGQIVALAFFALGLVYLTGAFLGNNRLLNPLDGLLSESTLSEQHLEFKKFNSLAELQVELAQAKQIGRPVMVDFFAEWCVACYEFEDFTFKDRRVQNFLNQERVLLLQADVTDNTKVHRDLMQHYQVLGLPTILLFDDEGIEQTRLRATGFESAEPFLQRLQAAFR
ncbi:MAG: protein-disulfide reductase DsbD [Gammaproteobacteria bacterium]|nr:protein-disulfide reductase DsbD [Gammaproteobacteria bacterium]